LKTIAKPNFVVISEWRLIDLSNLIQTIEGNRIDRAKSLATFQSSLGGSDHCDLAQWRGLSNQSNVLLPNPKEQTLRLLRELRLNKKTKLYGNGCGNWG
jgi:hypothetical protein